MLIQVEIHEHSAKRPQELMLLSYSGNSGFESRAGNRFCGFPQSLQVDSRIEPEIR